MAHRNASTVLFSLLGTAVLFLIFAGVSSLNFLEQHSYVAQIGWQEPTDKAPGIHGVCAPTDATSGFPLATAKQASPPNNCLKATNPLAQAMNYSLFFAVAAIIAVGAVNTMARRIP